MAENMRKDSCEHDATEHEKWIRIRVAMLVVAAILLLGTVFVPRQEGFQVIVNVMLGLGDALLIAGLCIDIRVIVKTRQARQNRTAESAEQQPGAKES